MVIFIEVSPLYGITLKNETLHAAGGSPARSVMVHRRCWS